MDFAYRWITCYLMREFNIFQIVRLWDTYLSEEEGFAEFHCYVCAALLLTFTNDIKQMNYQDCILFLQSLPTSKWKEEDLGMLMAKSYELKQFYHFNVHLFNS